MFFWGRRGARWWRGSRNGVSRRCVPKQSLGTRMSFAEVRSQTEFGNEDEFRGGAFPNGVWERGRVSQEGVPKRSLGTRWRKLFGCATASCCHSCLLDPDDQCAGKGNSRTPAGGSASISRPKRPFYPSKGHRLARFGLIETHFRVQNGRNRCDFASISMTKPHVASREVEGATVPRVPRHLESGSSGTLTPWIDERIADPSDWGC